jgi:hypothetical protein
MRTVAMLLSRTALSGEAALGSAAAAFFWRPATNVAPANPSGCGDDQSALAGGLNLSQTG